MYLRFDVGVPACTYKKFETNLRSWIPRAERGKKGNVKPSAFLKEKRGLRKWRTSFPRFNKKSDIDNPISLTKVTLIARHLLRGTLLSQSLNRRLIDFSLFCCLFSSRNFIHFRFHCMFCKNIHSLATHIDEAQKWFFPFTLTILFSS